MHKDFSPITVAPFSAAAITSFVRGVTGSSHRNEFLTKRQMDYICEYLAKDHIGAKTIVFESDYVDADYLDDYSEYYSRCFSTYEKTCSRLHFFSKDFKEAHVLDSLAINDGEFHEELDNAYLGFVVIRPIPHTFLARLCLVPYGEHTGNPEYQLITKPVEVSLFGIKLTVNTAPFIEQDQVVSRCATSALWTLLNSASGPKSVVSRSLSAITKSASSGDLGIRTFPTNGLTAPQITRSLKYYGLEPSEILLKNDYTDSLNELKEIALAYIDRNIPLLLGGRILRIDKDQNVSMKGRHLVCALGYHLNPERSTQDGEGGLNLTSHQIDKLFVHDDRHGPFMKLTPISTDDCAELENELKEKEKERDKLCYWEISLPETGNGDAPEIGNEPEYVREIFVPEIVILGTDPKIRIDYQNIYNLSRSFLYYTEQSYIHLANLSKEIADPTLRKSVDKVLASFVKIIEANWKIRLVSSTEYKQDLIKCDTFHAFNGAVDKELLLLKNLPRNMWVCSICEPDGTVISDILLDATEVPQGQLFIGFVSFQTEAQLFWEYIEQVIHDKAWFRENFDVETLKHQTSLLTFFETYKDRQLLNSQYGHLKFYDTDLDKIGDDLGDRSNHKRLNVIVLSRKDQNIELRGILKRDRKYIYVIDRHGSLVLAEHRDDPEEKCQHPRLVNGGLARLGGELEYHDAEEKWFINLKSEAYSTQIKEGSEIGAAYLDHIIEHNLGGADVAPIYP